jgi:hypothetical protein
LKWLHLPIHPLLVTAPQEGARLPPTPPFAVNRGRRHPSPVARGPWKALTNNCSRAILTSLVACRLTQSSHLHSPPPKIEVPVRNRIPGADTIPAASCRPSAKLCTRHALLAISTASPSSTYNLIKYGIISLDLFGPSQTHRPGPLLILRAETAPSLTTEFLASAEPLTGPASDAWLH